jgi:hypothetical protein
VTNVTNGWSLRHPFLVLAQGSAAALVLAGLGGATAVPRVRTLLATRRPIFAFAQGKGQVTWINRAEGGQQTGCAMDVRKLGGHRTAVYRLPSCALLRSVPLALADGEAAWPKDFNSCWNSECKWKVVGISSNPKHRRFSFRVSARCAAYPDGCSTETETGPIIAAFGSLLAYNADGLGQAQGAPGREWVDVLAGGRARRLFAVNGVIQGLGVEGGAIDTRSLVCSASCGTQSYEEEAHTALGRKLPPLPGPPVLAGNIAALADHVEGGITLYDSFTGEQLASVPVSNATNAFSLVGGDTQWVVFRIGRAISALNVNSDQIVFLTTTAPRPLGLSVSGRRLAWAENIKGRGGRIRALELPS